MEREEGSVRRPGDHERLPLASPVSAPKLGDVLYLPDGSGPWRVIDWTLADRVDAPGNVLVVEPVAG
jgi:hypothetical protein